MIKKAKTALPYLISALIVTILGAGGVFGFQKYEVYKAEKQLEIVNKVVSENKTTKENCKEILDFDKSTLEKYNKSFKEKEYDKLRKKCDDKYNIANLPIDEKTCEDIIKSNKEKYGENYIILDSFEDIRNKCIDKYFAVKFSTGTIFDIENDFKTSINLEFSLPFYEDKGELNSDEFLENRIEAKKRLADLLEISGGVKADYKYMVLYPKKATIYLNLQPLTKYSISIKSFAPVIEGQENNKKHTFTIEMPENKYFGFRVIDNIALYSGKTMPKFKLLEYNSLKQKTKIKICNIDKESYAKIEFFNEIKESPKERNEFFKTGIDKLETGECFEKEVILGDDKEITDEKDSESGTGQLNTSPNNSPSTTKGEVAREGGVKAHSQDFNFDDLIGTPAPNGLYYVTFSNPEDREFNSRTQEPVFFGVVNSHITMKISRNGEGFFFVNDLEGNALSGQKITAYVNEFIGKNSERNDETNERNNDFYYPIEKNIFSKEIELGTTGEDGILKVDLKGKLDDAFLKTFEDSRGYQIELNYNSFFVKSESESNLSYLSSKWNGGIAPWNFGYTVSNSRYGEKSENSDQIFLNSRNMTEPELYSHIYTDRRLYLPGEIVNIKGVFRKSTDLSITTGEEVKLKIKDSKGKEILDKDLVINEFGSVSDSIDLPKTSPLGNYTIYFYSDDNQIGTSGFSVEVFKNPKFKNEVNLKTTGLNGELVKIDKEEKDENHRRNDLYKGNFKIQANILSEYYSGSPVKSANYKYKVYKQYHYDSSYWDDCYYGCYREPQKELYTEGKGVLDEKGQASFEVPVDFESNYSDYKYIVEVTVEDNIGDKISGSNSIVARLPNEYKRWNPDSGVYFTSENRFYEAGQEITIDGGLTIGEWSKDYDDKFLMIIKKKDYETKMVDDVRGYERPITRTVENLEKIIKINSKNFELTPEGKLKLKYKLPETGEYIFEFGEINAKNLESKEISFESIIKEFENTKETKLVKNIEKEIEINYDTVSYLIENCSGNSETCDRETIYKNLGCENGYIDSKCEGKTKTVKMKQEFRLDNLIEAKSRKYFTIIAYGDEEANNPVVSDNKITILSEKVSYKIGETAKILVRLPFSKGKVLWTVEKQGVLKSEYEEVKGNIFFKEITIDDTFVPNAYIGLVAVDTTTGEKIPEYKVGYTEIVVDKTDKKSSIEIKTNKKEYQPREEVTIDINSKAPNGNGIKSELTIMVVDDSLISLMGNIDMNSLEKFYKKLPFQIQTSITNIAMLKRYYFSRKGIVGGSGFGNFKGGDSAVSSRNIFKNTAYYNPSVITDENGKAQVKFTLPDNLTNFRVMVISNSKDNFFGYTEDFIEVRKDVIIEDKTPIILRDGDKLEIGANIFNTTDKEIGFKLELESEGLTLEKTERETIIGGGKSEVIYWDIKELDSTKDEINYKITVLGDTPEHSDKIEGTIKVKQFPALEKHIIKSGIAKNGELYSSVIDLPENTDLEKSTVEVVFSNNRLNGVEKIVKSLETYPYGCIEQTTSSTYPNAIILKFYSLFAGIETDESKARENLKAGIKRIASMQTESGGFAYWQGESSPNLHITPFVLRRLVDMKEFGAEVPDTMIEDATVYLERNFANIKEDTDKAETFLSFVKVGKGQLAYDELMKDIDKEKLSRHSLIAYTYGLILFDKVKFKDEIENNINKIKGILNKDESGYRYWDKISDQAIFTSMLLDYNYDSEYTSQLIDLLYSKDWGNYYYSTQAKNNAFIAFSKYIEKIGKDRYNKLGFSLGKQLNTGKLFWLGNGAPNIVKKEYKLKDVLYNDKIDLSVANIQGTEMYVDLILKQYPKDKTKVKEYSNGMTVKREIYEVVDESDMETKCNRSNGKNTCTQPQGLKLYTGNTFKEGDLYKVVVTASFNESETRRNAVIEDYLPSSFRVINSKFETESAIVRQNTNGESRNSHIEFKPDVVFYTRDHVRGDSFDMEYFFTPEFSGSFTYPPVSAYMMYNPEIRANGEYRKIVVR